MNDIEIRTIFYDEDSRSKIREPFIPLDNTLGDPSWYEFWPILDFLIHNQLEDDVYYGFLSPKFTEKTGYTSEAVITKIRENNSSEVFLFSHAWHDLAYFVNPWEQGELMHKGIVAETQAFLDHENIDIKILNFITSRRTSVFSNYVVATKKYWDAWKDLAIKFFFYASNPTSSLAFSTTKHRDTISTYPLKVFIQERLSSIILSNNHFETVVVDVVDQDLSIFIDTKENRSNLMLCDSCKETILTNGNTQSRAQAYADARNKVLLKQIK